MITLWSLKRELTWVQESVEINLDDFFSDHSIEKMCVYFGLEKIEEVGKININLYSIGWKKPNTKRSANSKDPIDVIQTSATSVCVALLSRLSDFMFFHMEEIVSWWCWSCEWFDNVLAILIVSSVKEVRILVMFTCNFHIPHTVQMIKIQEICFEIKLK